MSAAPTVAEGYTEALRAHLAGAGEAALQRAYEVGRRALYDGLGPLDLVSMHREAVASMLASAQSVDEASQLFARAWDVCRESLSAFEMTQRGYREANSALRKVNEALEQRTRELAATNALLAARNTELAREKERAERESRFKSRFLMNMTHELRTPLNAIIGFAELLAQGVGGSLPSQQCEYVRRMLESAQHLLALVDDVLDLSKVEAGRMELRREPTTVASLIDVVRGVLLPLAEREGVALEVSLPPELPALDVDPVRATQILMNLMSNAIKFTPRGGRVRVEAHVAGDFVEISVADTGIGIASEDLPRLFREFERVSARVDGVHRAGTGLGLALSKRLIELHGGTVHVQSERGRGSVFTFTLPKAAVTGGRCDDR